MAPWLHSLVLAEHSAQKNLYIWFISGSHSSIGWGIKKQSMNKCCFGLAEVEAMQESIYVRLVSVYICVPACMLGDRISFYSWA